MTQSPLLDKQFVTLCCEVDSIRSELRRQRWHNRLVILVLSALCLLAVGQTVRGQPAAELAKAVADIRRLPSDVARQVRYLSLYNFPDAEDRQRVIVAVSMLLNSASQSALIVKPTLVDETLLRFDLAAYGWSEEQWEQLVADGEPYWHLTTEVATEIDQRRPILVGDFRIKTKEGESSWYSAARIRGWIDGGSLAADRAIQQRGIDGQLGPWTTVTQLLVPIVVKETQVVQTDGGWLSPQLVTQLKSITGSRGAIARADWFIAKLCEPDFYYAFAGVGTSQREHYAVLGVDEKQVDALLIEKGTNIFARGPTGKPGRIARFNSLVGGIWATYDVANANVGVKDPFRDPTAKFKHNFDAGESFVQGRNGLWQFNLYDANGAIVGAADPDVATDGTAPEYDATLRTPISCFRCHAQRGSGGIIDLTYDQQRILNKSEISSADAVEIAKLQAFYGRTERLEIEMQRDREDADTAAKEATGVSWSAAALAIARVHDEYVYGRVSLDVIKQELATDDLRPLLQSQDPLALAAAANHGFAGVIRGQWETAFAEAMARIQGAQQ
ncbi:MAG: hypothetical protein MPJ50_02520 [Pirellulales bacterium]|nr:hypothetical protein [Pirellulales bacterium]